jgi:hypothetical protein
MSERFGFATSWREIHRDRVERDYATLHWWTSYDQAHQQHRKACNGDWVSEVMVDAQVGELIGHDGGKQRVIRSGRDLWTDDRPAFGREDFAKLWRGWKDRPLTGRTAA